MTTFLTRGDRVLFQGDSLTDWGRDGADPTNLGHGWVTVAQRSPALVVPI